MFKPTVALEWTPATLGILLMFIIPGFYTGASGQEVTVYVSSKAGDRLARKSPLHFEATAPGKPSSFQIDAAVEYHKIVGFGASFLEAGLVCLNSVAPAEQEAVLRALFDPKAGAGFSAMKTTLAGTDFMAAGPWYTYDDTPGDAELEHFSIARDLAAPMARLRSSSGHANTVASSSRHLWITRRTGCFTMSTKSRT